jgi:hypothetical protein
MRNQVQFALAVTTLAGMIGCGEDLRCGEGTRAVEGFCLVDTGEEADADADSDSDADADADADGDANQPPTQPTISIEPNTPSTDNDLLCLITADSQDPEGGFVSYTYGWAVDTQPAGNDTQMVDSSMTSSGQMWACRVTPSDGTQSGPFGLASVTIQ